jgi:flavin reductase (DIM6/NTAB) family NADH-FMN oxidoreductase RutF
VLERIGTQNLLYPMPVTIVGTLESNRVNFVNIAHVGILNAIAPHKISLGINKNHFTNHVIRKTCEFSINLPSQDMVTATDYVGMVSGKSVDKSSVFETFFGTLKSAPLVKKCPLAMECRLIDT